MEFAVIEDAAEALGASLKRNIVDYSESQEYSALMGIKLLQLVGEE